MIKTPKKQSKRVLEFATIEGDVRAMDRLLKEYVSPAGKTSGDHYAIHHSQFSPVPYNFFVINKDLFGDGKGIMVVVNPKIVEKSEPVMHREACMSFPFRNGIRVRRYRKVTVQYRVPDDKGEKMVAKEEDLEGMMAFIFQHEIQHAHGLHIYQGNNSR